ncbi:hypothetical protein FE782_21065 [Paenibacillus antri]|uniref:Protein kinase domain-containing protein n=2 Tax=Paenibacillus antri TaxID=2582848 RepID=A0A5R9G1F2_9BACL|nr:hypothetical protein FE782_21065 [Paenibacillus antri]
MMDEEIRDGPFRSGDVAAGRYRIVRRIGEGGMGRVYLAEDLRLAGQRWAVKWVPVDAAFPSQPEKEAAIMTSLRHPSLPRIVDYFGAGEEGVCIVMDYLEGETLLQRSAAHDHALPWTTVVHYGAQLCDLLDYLHSLDSPIVFRDMKPSNVIVGPDDAVRLVDFGIARTYKEGKASDTVHVGSVGFAAPELLANLQTDHRADLYSLGSLLYFLLSGGQFYNFTKKPIEAVADAIPPELAAALHRLLADEPSRRFPDAKTAKASLLASGPKPVAGGTSVPGAGGTGHAATGRRTVVAVYGLFPKVGATFTAVAIAKLLAERKLYTTYMGFPWAAGDAFLRMVSATRDGESEWREDRLAWRLAPDEEGQEDFDAARLYKLLFETKGDVAVFDVPSKANPEAAEALLRVSDAVVAVVSPDPGGLRSSAAVDNWRRLNACAGDGRIEWVANRVPSGVRLNDFYKLFSIKPAGTIREFSYDRMIGAMWNGRFLCDETDVREELSDALQPLLRKLAPGKEKESGFRASAKRWLANKWSIDYNKNKFHP